MTYSRVFSIYYTIISTLYTLYLKNILINVYTSYSNCTSYNNKADKASSRYDYSYQVYTNYSSTFQQKGHNYDLSSVVVLVRFICSQEHKIDDVRQRQVTQSDHNSAVRYIDILLFLFVLTIICLYCLYYTYCVCTELAVAGEFCAVGHDYDRLVSYGLHQWPPRLAQTPLTSASSSRVHMRAI